MHKEGVFVTVGPPFWVLDDGGLLGVAGRILHSTDESLWPTTNELVMLASLIYS